MSDLGDVVAAMTGQGAEPLVVRCPHCGQANDAATGLGGHTLADAMKVGAVMLLCTQCTGFWIHTEGADRIVTLEEWLDLPAETRGSIQRAVKMVQEFKDRFC